MKKALETMPMTLDDAFRRILERVESQDPMSATTALRTLTWVYYARRPLTIAELGEALVVEEGDPNRREDAIIESISIIDCYLELHLRRPYNLLEKTCSELVYGLPPFEIEVDINWSCTRSPQIFYNSGPDLSAFSKC